VLGDIVKENGSPEYLPEYLREWHGVSEDLIKNIAGAGSLMANAVE